MQGHTEDTFGALDLGGASTQVAFPVSSDASSEDITELTLYGRKYRVFAVSYLCYGVNEIRRRFLAHIIAQQVSLVTGFSSSLVVGPFILQEYRDTIVSPCHNSGYTFNLTAKDIFESYCTITPQTESWLQQHPDAVSVFAVKNTRGSGDGDKWRLFIVYPAGVHLCREWIRKRVPQCCCRPDESCYLQKELQHLSGATQSSRAYWSEVHGKHASGSSGEQFSMPVLLFTGIFGILLHPESAQCYGHAA